MNLKNLLSGELGIGPAVIGLGTFDGVHLGHRTLLSEMIRYSREKGVPAVIFTFDRAPRCLLSMRDFPGEITTPEEKFSLLLGCGVDWVVFRPFDKEFAQIGAREFVNEIIIKQLNARAVFTGFNFGFGNGREGNAALLQKMMEEKRLECVIIPPVKVDSHIVSSTIIREAIEGGDLETANSYLGREFSISGIVVHGDHRGRKMGFPTANLDLSCSSKVIPPRGVYLCTVDSVYGSHYALINVGVRPTFDRNSLTLEAHLLDFRGDLYNTCIRTRFITQIRREICFPSMEQLVGQIKLDMSSAEKIIKMHSK